MQKFKLLQLPGTTCMYVCMYVCITVQEKLLACPNWHVCARIILSNSTYHKTELVVPVMY